MLTPSTVKRSAATEAGTKAAVAKSTRLPAPRWDNNRVLFEIDDGERRIECAISRQALEEAVGRRSGRPLEFLASFSKLRTRIERLALEKVRAHGDPISGPVTIWSGDLDGRQDKTGPDDRATQPPLAGK